MKRLTTLCATALCAFSVASAQTPCVDGFAGDYPCDGLDLLSVRTLEELGGGANGNDCWGWVDPGVSAGVCVVRALQRIVHCGGHGCGESRVLAQGSDSDGAKLVARREGV